MTNKVTQILSLIAFLLVVFAFPAQAQFTVNPTSITTTGTSGSTATGTTSIAVNWTFTGANSGGAITATYTVNGVSSSPVTCVKSGTGGTRTYTCPAANINLS